MDRIGSLPVSCHGRRQHGVLYHVRKLDIAGAMEAAARAVNNDGLVVGYRVVGETVIPTLWAGTRPYNLNARDGLNGEAYGIGESGAVVGQVILSGPPTRSAGALWYRGGRWILRSPDPDNPIPRTMAVDINRSGTIVGTHGSLASDDDRPVVWRRGVPRLLPPLVSLAYAYAINDAGFVVGSGDYPGGVLRQHALLWTPEGRVVDLDPRGVLDSRAYDINNKGKIVGWAEPFGGEVPRPALWYRGRRTALPITGGIAGGARAINERDQVVGYQSAGLPVTQRAVTWYGTTAYQLDTLLDEESRGTVINDAQDINDKGQILASIRLPSGINQPLLLTPRPCYRR